MQTVRISHPVTINGADWFPLDIVEVSDADAIRLVTAGYAVYAFGVTPQDPAADQLAGLLAQMESLSGQLADLNLIPGPKGKSVLVSEFPLPQSGDVSQYFFLPEPVSEIMQPTLQADTAPTGSGVQVEIEADSGSGFSTILGSTLELGVTENWKVGAKPTVQNLPANTRLRTRIVSAPVTTVSSLTRRSAIGSTNSGAGALSSVTLVKPVGAATGDLLIAFVARQSPTITPPAGWTILADVQTDPTTVQGQVTILGAINSPSLALGVGMSAGSPVITAMLAFQGFDTAKWNSAPSTYGQNNQGPTITLPAYTVGDSVDIATEPSEHVVFFALARYIAADDGRVRTWGGSGVGAIFDAGTTRGATNTDIGFGLAELATNQPDETVVVQPTVGDAAGVASTSWCSGTIGIRAGLVSGSAARMVVQVMVR